MQTVALLVDVGADVCRLALLTDTGEARPAPTRYREYLVAGHASVQTVIARYLEECGLEAAPQIAAVAISGPAKSDVFTITQTGWTFTRQDLIEAFGFRDLLVMNDNAAMALSLAWLQPHDFTRLGGSEGPVELPSAGRFAVVTPDTGLGVSAIEFDPEGYRLLDSEGGHASFAPTEPLEAQIADEIRKSLPRVSWERLLSWPGLARIHSALAALEGAAVGEMQPLEVLLYGRTGADRRCAKALKVFCGLLGEFAGDVALTLCSLDGVFVSGRFVLEASELIGTSDFRRRFENKGRMSALVRDIPAYAVLNRGYTLLGLARAADEHRKRSGSTPQPSAVPPEVINSAMLDGASNGVLLLSPSLDILVSNDRYWLDAPISPEMRQSGRPFGPCLKAMAMCGLFGEEAPAAIVDRLTAQLTSGQPFTMERTVFGGRILSERCSPSSGGVMVIVSSDVTQARLRNRELEILAVSLRESRDKAEAANRSKSQFLANMSHEIRTPMNGVLGMTEVLGRTDLSASQREMLEVIQSSGENLLAVINDILDVSAVEAGKLTLRPRPFDLCAMVEDLASLLEPRARAKGVEIAVRYRPSVPTTVVADPDRMRQVVTNLVGNAVKFTDVGHVLIDVDAVCQGGSCRFAIAVTDTGPGIPKDSLASVFGMFEQVDMSATRRFEGAGLGLNISQRIAEAMGGRTGVESVLGEGSTFTVEVSLPVVEAALQPFTASLRGRRVLVVDDRAINRRILVERLQAWGMSAEEADGGVAALAAVDRLEAEGARYDLGILDMQMPGMNGSRLAREIRARPTGSQLPMILLTSAEMCSAKDLEPFATHLTKPARAAALEAAIREALGGPAPSKPAPVEPTPETVPSEVGARRWRLLVAEDHPVNMKVIQAYLAEGPYDLIFAFDGEEAAERYRQERPDLVLMDISMPRVDGFEASRMIRAMEAESGWPPVPIVALTANVMGDVRARCREAGMDAHLAKPIKPAELMAALQERLPRAGDAPSPRRRRAASA
jgi:glucokinase